MKPAAIWRAAGLVVLVGAAAVIPLAKNVTVTHVGVFVLLYVGAAVGWNIFSGFTGYISLGAAVFFGVGVYTVALISKHLDLVGGVVFALYPLAGLAAAVVAVPFGLVALRVRRHTFVVVTIAIFFIFQFMASNFSWTGGVSGIFPPFLDWDPNTFDMPFYYTALVVAVASAVLAWAIWGSRFGLQLRAIRDDEDRARGLGVKTMRVKLTAFVISGFIIGILGGLYFYFQSEALPEYAFNPFFDLTVALMAFIGGFGTLSGPIFGALLLEPYLGYAQYQVTNAYVAEIVLGALFLVVIIFLPRGILPTAGEKLTALAAGWQRRAASRDTGPPPGTPGSPAGAAAAGSTASTGPAP
ncbi:MAG TPA: branched-chain amino acid ABC transporter permease [Streptosporangiaceae bacterium]|nr:branched-chain amino acid ABC transporter permease [Streptosporangiaceae bacterium]